MAVERVPGVVSAEFSYEQGAGVVTYDPEETDAAAFIEELKDKTGFVATLVSSPDTTSGTQETTR